MRKPSFLAFTLLALLTVPSPAQALANNDVPTPPGYSVVVDEQLAQGVSRLQITRTDPPERVNIAILRSDSRSMLRSLLSNDEVEGRGSPLERTSEMCARVSCLVGVNGDFFTTNGPPLGGVVIDGESVRSPNLYHHQFMIAADGHPLAGPLRWSGALVSTDLRRIALNGINIERDADQVVLYTHWFGGSTETNRFGVELTGTFVESGDRVSLGRTTVLQLTGIRLNAGDTPIPAGGVVLSGHGRGARALLDLWSRVRSGAASDRVLVRTETSPAVTESIGGTPILVRDGARWVSDEPKDLQGRHPRTMVGWNKAGTIFLVTVDGRQASSAGMTLEEGADLMMALGATDAINLDGGGSTTFTVKGSVVNNPSDRIVSRDGKQVVVREPAPGEHALGYVERPVADALVILLKDVVASGRLDPFAGDRLRLPLGGAATTARSQLSELPQGSRGSLKGPLGGMLFPSAAIVSVAVRRRRRKAA